MFHYPVSEYFKDRVRRKWNLPGIAHIFDMFKFVHIVMHLTLFRCFAGAYL